MRHRHKISHSFTHTIVRDICVSERMGYSVSVSQGIDGGLYMGGVDYVIRPSV